VSDLDRMHAYLEELELDQRARMSETFEAIAAEMLRRLGSKGRVVIVPTPTLADRIGALRAKGEP
jgi:hypothetical protein